MSFVIVGPMGDGSDGYWNGRGELWRDRNKAKVYKQFHAAAVVADDYGYRVVSIGLSVGDTILYTNAELPCEVRILAIAEGYAMVRRKGCIPFVASVKELTPNADL